jgi:hypothetical protein
MSKTHKLTISAGILHKIQPGWNMNHKYSTCNKLGTHTKHILINHEYGWSWHWQLIIIIDSFTNLMCQCQKKIMRTYLLAKNFEVCHTPGFFLAQPWRNIYQWLKTIAQVTTSTRNIGMWLKIDGHGTGHGQGQKGTPHRSVSAGHTSQLSSRGSSKD